MPWIRTERQIVHPTPSSAGLIGKPPKRWNRRVLASLSNMPGARTLGIESLERWIEMEVGSILFNAGKDSKYEIQFWHDVELYGLHEACSYLKNYTKALSTDLYSLLSILKDGWIPQWQEKQSHPVAPATSNLPSEQQDPERWDGLS